MTKHSANRESRSHAAIRQGEVPFAAVLLVSALLLPNLNALVCGFVLDDMPLIVDDPNLHSLANLPTLWTSGYWPDRLGLTLYRPLTKTLWLLLWCIGGGRAVVFHVVNVLLGAAIVVLIYRLLISTGFTPFLAFSTAVIFAVLPIHTEAITSIVGSAELLAALFGVSALLAFHRGRQWIALLLFALAILSKESAATLLGAGWLIAPKPRSKHLTTGVLAAAVVAAALVLRRSVSAAPAFIPPIDNPSAFLPAWQRCLTALWVQCLYIAKTVLSLSLSADYSYRQIRLVMGFADDRAWCAVALAVAGALLLWTWPGRQARSKTAESTSIRLRRACALGVLLWAILFSATSNILFPIGTLMGERLAYAPTIAIALMIGVALDVLREKAGNRAAFIAITVLVIAYGSRTFVRNRDWRDAHAFYRVLVQASPNSCKSHYFYGALLASEGDDAGAVREYDRAIAIFPAYSEAYHNRGNALARLGRFGEAMESYRMCLRFDPGHVGAAQNLAVLEAGGVLNPPRKRL